MTGGRTAPDPLLEARRARAAGKPDHAHRLCAALLAKRPKDASAHHFMAILAGEAGRLDAALPHARKAVKLAPRAYPARLELARILLLSGREKSALQESAAALALRPDDLPARFEHARILYNSSRMNEAEPILAEVAKAKPKLAEPHAMLAAIAATFQRWEEAIARADAAVAAGLDTADIHEIRGRALLGLERFAEAKQALARALALEPNRLSAMRGLSVVSRELGDRDLAAALLQKHARLAPFEKSGDEGARTRVLVSDDMTFSGGFLAHMVSRMYSGANYIGGYFHPEILRIHYLANQTDPREVMERAGGAHVLFNNLANSEVIEKLGGPARLQQSFESTGLPIINPLDRVLAASRANNYARFKDDPNFIFPRTVRFDAGDDPEATARRILAEFAPPFLIRPTISHVRSGLRLVESPEALLNEGRGIVAGGSYYAIDFYPSTLATPVGGLLGALQFRVAVVGGKIFPDRLTWTPDSAFTSATIERFELRYDERGLTDMEKTFFARPEAILGRSLEDLFGGLVRTVGLDVFGIDFGLTQQGRIIVFEANSAMSLFSVKHETYAPYRRAPRAEFGEAFARFLHNKAGT